jgi:hypothetical protein
LAFLTLAFLTFLFLPPFFLLLFIAAFFPLQEVGRKFAWARRKESNGKNSVSETKKKSNYFNH